MNPMDLSGATKICLQESISGPTVAWGWSRIYIPELLRTSPNFSELLRTSPNFSEPPPQTVGHSPPPVLPQPRKYFSKYFSKTFCEKMKNTPTQICPLGTHEQQIFAFLFEAFPQEKMGGVFFKIARARARARARGGGPRASRAQNEGRPAQIAPFCIFSTFCIFGTSWCILCPCTHRPPAEPFDRGAQPAAW